jgi:hypothetical protein
VNGQADPSETDSSKPAFCFSCSKQIAFAPEPQPRVAEEDYASMKEKAVAARMSAPERVEGYVSKSNGKVQTIFEAKPGEKILAVKELSGGQFVFVTEQRAVLLNLGV